MDFFIHIGQTKAGSTSIQNYLFTNYPSLLKAGALFPKSLFSKKKSFLNRTSGHNLLIYDFEGAISKLVSELEIHNGIKKVILSSELLLGQMHILKSLKSKLCMHNIKVIVYLRKQHNHMESLYREMVSNGYKKYHAGFEYFVKTNRHSYNYLHNISYLEEIFGRENLIIAPYDKGTLPNGDVVLDFLAKVGLRKMATEHSARQDNISAPAELVKILAVLNQLPMEKKTYFNFISHIREKITPNFEFDPCQNFLALAKGKFESALDFCDSNSKLADSYPELRKGDFTLKPKLDTSIKIPTFGSDELQEAVIASYLDYKHSDIGNRTNMRFVEVIDNISERPLSKVDLSEFTPPPDWMKLEKEGLQYDFDVQENGRYMLTLNLFTPRVNSRKCALITIKANSNEKVEGFTMSNKDHIGLYRYISLQSSGETERRIAINVGKNTTKICISLIPWKNISDIYLTRSPVFVSG